MACNRFRDSGPYVSMVGNKFRLRFRKDRGLRFLSHHDLMRCFERMTRRAELPLRFTAGFHPTPRIVFALSLPLGLVGTREVVEIELLDSIEAADLLARLQSQAPEGLTFLDVRVIEERANAVPRRAVYSLPVPDELVETVAAAANELQTATPVWVERSRPRPRRVNIRPYLRDIRVDASDVRLDLWVTQNGSARADEVLRLLGLEDVLAAGVILTRTDLELHDEVEGDSGDAPPDGPPETEPLQAVPIGAAEEDCPTATWGATPNGPVVE